MASLLHVARVKIQSVLPYFMPDRGLSHFFQRLFMLMDSIIIFFLRSFYLLGIIAPIWCPSKDIFLWAYFQNWGYLKAVTFCRCRLVKPWDHCSWWTGLVKYPQSINQPRLGDIFSYLFLFIQDTFSRYFHPFFPMHNASSRKKHFVSKMLMKCT